MLFVDDERIELKKLDNYKGDDYVMRQLSSAYQQVKELGFPIKFKCDSLHRGFKEGKKGIFLPFGGEIDTPTGSAMIVYAQSARSAPGGIGVDFRPRGETLSKTWVLNEKDLDKILFLMIGCPRVRSGEIYIEDLEKKASEIAKKRTAGSALSFYLYNEHSPLFANEERLMTIALALGISTPKDYGLNELKNAIFDKVESAEKIADRTYGYKWFTDAVDEFTPVMSALKDIQTAIDCKVIRFNDRTFKWMLLDSKGEDFRILCPVEPAKTSLRREILAAYCLRDKEVYDLLLSSATEIKRKEDAIGDVSLSRELDGNESVRVDFTTLPWPELRTLARKNNILIKGKTKAELIKELEFKRESLI